MLSSNAKTTKPLKWKTKSLLVLKCRHKKWPLCGWSVTVPQVLNLYTKLFIMFVLRGFFTLKQVTQNLLSVESFSPLLCSAMSLMEYIFGGYLSHMFSIRGCCVIRANIQDYDMIVYKLKLQPCYNIHFQSNTFGKAMNSLIPHFQLWVK